MDPHSYRHAEANVEPTATKLVQVGGQQSLSCTGVHDIESGVGNGSRERAALFGSLNQVCINVTAEEAEVLSIHRMFRVGMVKAKEVLIEGDTQFLKRGKREISQLLL